MTYTKTKHYLLNGTNLFALLGSLTLSQAASAQTVILKADKDMDEITTTGQQAPNPALSTAIPKDSNRAPSADGGDFLRSVPGLTSGRMGGHALEPVIRGQTRSQLNIITDGASIMGAGPNRMDTPASFVDIDSADLVIIQRGYQSVKNGAGGTGGTILFEHNAPSFEDGRTFKGRAALAYESNGDIWTASGGVAAKAGDFTLRLDAHSKDAGSYKDGDGNLVRSSYELYGGTIEGGYTTENTALIVALTHEKNKNTLFPGAGMDSPEGDGTIIRGKLRHDFSGSDILKSMKINLYRSKANHIMDNFSLRERYMMFRQADLSAITTGGAFNLDLVMGESDISIGMDVKNISHDGLRTGNNMMPDMLDQIQSVLIPDASVKQMGFYAEAISPLSDNLSLKSGFRFDHIKADSAKGDLLTTLGMPVSANKMVEKYYGLSPEKQTENNVGGLLRLEYNMSRTSSFYLGLSHSNRTANTTERYMASNMMPMMPGGMNPSWIGNPFLKPEKHTQVDLGYGFHNEDQSFLISVYYDEVNDFIFRDHARGQLGIVQSDGALIYRNIDARLYGIEVEGKTTLGQAFELSGDLTYTHGHNKDIDIPLDQIPALMINMSLSYHQDQWDGGIRLRAALDQNRVDDNAMIGSGRDAQATPGYAVADLFASYNLSDRIKARFGISNIFNTTYANHLNRESLNDATSVQVNEAGRSFYLRLAANF